MERSDAQIKATLLMLELPIRSTSWYIKPADNSRKAKKIADFVEDSLFNKINFDDFVKESTTMFTYGHSVFEKVYAKDKSNLIWSKFATRPQSTLYDFVYDACGNLTEIEQLLITNAWQKIKIPTDKLIVFSHDMKQGDYRGRSALRAAYKHWSIKDFLYKITNIGIERNLVGTPKVTLPENYSDDDYEVAKRIVTSLRSNEYGGVTMPPGFLLELFEGKRTLMDVLPYIEYQDLLISRSILAQFMNLGGGKSGGSYSLSQDQSGLFLMMLGAIAKSLANTINESAIKQLVKYNFNSDLYPKLCFRPLGSYKILETLKLLTDGKLIIPDKNLEEYIRDMLELPEKSEPEEMYNQPPQEMPPEPDKELGVSASSELPKEDKKEMIPEEDMEKIAEDEEEAKKLSEAPGAAVNWEGVDADFNKLEAEFRTEGRTIIERQVTDLTRKVQKLKLEDIATVQVGYKGAMTTFMLRMFTKSFEAGVKQVQGELKTDNTPKLNEAMLQAKAAVVANNISERVKVVFLSEYLKQKGLVEDTVTQFKNVMSKILGAK
jgi:phage gp29-like protein